MQGIVLIHVKMLQHLRLMQEHHPAVAEAAYKPAMIPRLVIRWLLLLSFHGIYSLG